MWRWRHKVWARSQEDMACKEEELKCSVFHLPSCINQLSIHLWMVKNKHVKIIFSFIFALLRSYVQMSKFFLYHCQQWNQRPPHLRVYETLKDWTLPQHGAQKQPYHLSQWELYQLQSSSWTLILFWWESSQGVALSVKVLALPYRCNGNHLYKWHLSLQRSEH